VFRWEGGGWKPGGEDSEAAIAFLPANDAFCHIKEAMLRLEAGGYLAKYGLVNQIHDALMFECPDPLVEECVATVRATMEQASDILVRDGVGLQVNVGVARGKRWNSMLEIG
jgi:DNA polymerase I-like protein with 3'-5' exonuclease and polymerase domains